MPTAPEEWIPIGDILRDRGNVPHAMGALDGKQVLIRKRAMSGCLYYNYKGFFSVVRMALVDGDYKFVWVDICSGYGSMSDAQIFNNSELKECLEHGNIEFPESFPISKDNESMPYFILGDCLWNQDLIDEAGGGLWFQLPTLKVQGQLQQQQLALQELLGLQHLGQWWSYYLPSSSSGAYMT